MILSASIYVAVLQTGLRYTIGIRMKKVKKFNWKLFILAVPGLAFLIAFNYVPLFGLIIPFKKMDYAKGILGSDWVGLKNFEFFFQSQDAFRITRNTICLNLLFISVTIFLSVLLAVLLFERSKRQVKVFQTAMFVPYFISWVVGGYILYALISPQLGVLPNMIKDAGGVSPSFYFEPKYWPAILLIAYFWKNVGYMTLMFYTALMSIDISYLEAASIDGANRLQRTLRITIPFIAPTIVMITLLQIGKIFYSDFGMFYFLTKDSGALYPVADVIDTYVYRALRVSGDIGMASAVGLYQSLVGFILVLISNYTVKRFDKDYGIF